MVYFTCVYATCNKRIDCKQTVYSFQGYYKAYPDKDSIRVNDTIWLELTTPTQLNDLTTNQVVDYSKAENFGPSIRYGEFTSGDILNPGVTPAADYFNNVLVWGTSIQSDKLDQVRGFRCLEEGEVYKFKIGIIPKKEGFFLIAPSNATGVYRSTNKCDKASFKLTFKDTDQHLYLYEQKRPGYVLSDNDRGHLYAFKVY